MRDELLKVLPDTATLDAVDDDQFSGRRPCPIVFTIAQVRELRALLADGRGEGVEAREQIAVHYLSRIFAAQRLREDGSYAGWKIAGKGSLNEVVAEARDWLNIPLAPSPEPPAAALEGE